MKSIKLKKGEALMLRTCKKDGSSSHGFVWPKKGPVRCEDWNPTKTCGHGLHGLLWGQGDGSLLDWDVDAAWLVVRITEHVDLGEKIKVSSGVVEYFGTRLDATALIAAHAPLGTVIAGGTASAGYRGTASAGYRGTASAGDRGTASAGDRGTASAGVYGTASAGDEGTASAGVYGTASAGYRGTASAGVGGCISILYWNGHKYKRAVFAVGKDGIEPGVSYRVNEKGEPVRVEKAGAA